MDPRQLRALRGAAAAVIATVLAATSHTLSGGTAPYPLFVAAVAVLASPVAVALAGRRLALWRVALTVLASQGLLHTAFAFAGDAAPVTRMPGHVHAVTLSPLASSVAGPDARMIAGHVVAALVTIAVLHRGERALRAVGRGILRLLRAVVPVPSPRRPLSLAATVDSRVARASVILSGVSRRGPPVVAAAR